MTAAARVLRAQAVLTLALTAAVWLAADGERAVAAAFGAALGMLATLVTAVSVLESSRMISRGDDDAGGGGLLPLYSGLLVKLLLVAGGAYLALAWFGLRPLYVVLGYITMQAAYLHAAPPTPRRDS